MSSGSQHDASTFLDRKQQFRSERNVYQIHSEFLFPIVSEIMAN